MATNEILLFAETDTGTNLLTQAEYLADSQRPIGNQPGVARSKLVNKALRQSSVIAAGVAEFIAQKQANNITDNLTPQTIANYLQAAVGNSNAATATKLQTPRTLTIGSTGKSFDGSADVSWSLAEIGVTAFGLGGAAASVPGNNIDDSSIPTGFYYVTTTTSGTKPTGDDGYGHLIVSREGGGVTARQLYLDNSTSRIWTRVWTPSLWSGWDEIYSTGNLGAASETAAGIVELATAAEAQALASAVVALTPARLADAFKGSNQLQTAYYGYQKLPGGLIIQWGAVSGYSTYTINFPIAFPAGPIVMVANNNGTTGTISATCAYVDTTKFGLHLSTTGSAYWIAIGH